MPDTSKAMPPAEDAATAGSILAHASSIVKAKRLSLGKTQAEFAALLGLAKNGDLTVKRWESGAISPSLSELTAIQALHMDVPFPNQDAAKYKAIDLFCGIGGTRLGFYKTGEVSFVFSSEINEPARQTYFANYGEMPFGDITQIPSEQIPDHDILIGGFPCQAFSQAGLKRGFEDARGTLFFEIARILKDKRPKAFLLENVKNLKTHDQGRTFQVIQSTLQELNYDVFFHLFKARDFGVPQNRERIYIVGFDREQVANSHAFQFPEPLTKKVCVGDILEDSASLDSKYTISDRLWQGHQERKARNKAAGKGFGYSLFNAQSPYTNTISARYYKDGSEILIDQSELGKNPRKLTPREAARLQGFPEEFKLCASDTQAYRQFGNSVAVPVIYAIAQQILKVLNGQSSPLTLCS